MLLRVRKVSLFNFLSPAGKAPTSLAGFLWKTIWFAVPVNYSVNATMQGANTFTSSTLRRPANTSVRFAAPVLVGVGWLCHGFAAKLARGHHAIWMGAIAHLRSILRRFSSVVASVDE